MGASSGSPCAQIPIVILHKPESSQLLRAKGSNHVEPQIMEYFVTRREAEVARPCPFPRIWPQATSLYPAGLVQLAEGYYSQVSAKIHERPMEKRPMVRSRYFNSTIPVPSGLLDRPWRRQTQRQRSHRQLSALPLGFLTGRRSVSGRFSDSQAHHQDVNLPRPGLKRYPAASEPNQLADRPWH